MKLNIEQNRSQGDPYVIKSNGIYYMYSTHGEGVHLYSSKDKMNWDYRGIVFTKIDEKEYWAPAVIEIDNKFYMYVSTMGINETDTHKQRILVAVSNKPDDEFKFIKYILDPFSIDPHVVKSGKDLYIFYSMNDYDAQRAGTLIVVDKMKSPIEVEGHPKVVVRATLDEEIFMRNRFKKGQHWHTIEGAYYFRKDDYHYVLYSGNCFNSENYYIGYAVAKGDTDNLLELDFKKYPDDNTYHPLLRKNDEEEGTGHNSMIIEDGHYYIIYHGRDYNAFQKNKDVRTARICEIAVNKEELKVIKR